MVALDAVGGAPAPHGRARGGECAGFDRNDLTVGVGGRRAVFAGKDPPAVLGRGTGGRDVATEPDERARGSTLAQRSRGGKIGGQRFAARAEVELDTARDPDRPLVGIEQDGLPARDRCQLDDDLVPRPVRLCPEDRGEIPVVPDDPHRVPHRRIDGSIRLAGDRHGRGDGLPQQGADRRRVTRVRLDLRQLAVVTESAVGAVHLVEDGVHGGTSRVEIAVEDEQVDPHAEGAPRGLPEHRYEDPVETCARPLPRVTPLLDDPLEELDPLSVDPFDVEPPVVDCWSVPVEGVAVGVDVVVVLVDGVSVFGVPA
jgi:hypothetical protein